MRDTRPRLSQLQQISFPDDTVAFTDEVQQHLGDRADPRL
jgi:hypothetical protein